MQLEEAEAFLRAAGLDPAVAAELGASHKSSHKKDSKKPKKKHSKHKKRKKRKDTDSSDSESD